MSEEEYSLREETTFRQNLFKRLDTQDEILKEIRMQTTKTNGRVNLLEIKTSDYENIKKTTDNLKGWKMWLSGAVAVIIFFGGAFITLFYQVQKYDQENFIRETIKNERPQTVSDVILELNKDYNLIGIPPQK